MPVIRSRKGKWLAAWLGGAAIGVGNGIAREATFARHFPAERASQLSALTGIFAFAAYFQVLERRWPLRDYDLRRGRLWPLVLASIAVGPELARRSAAT